MVGMSHAAKRFATALLRRRRQVLADLWPILRSLLGCFHTADLGRRNAQLSPAAMQMAHGQRRTRRQIGEGSRGNPEAATLTLGVLPQQPQKQCTNRTARVI